MTCANGALAESNMASYDEILDRLRDIDPNFSASAENSFAAHIVRGAAALDEVMAGLKSEDATRRADAAEALGVLGDTRSLSVLRKALKDPDGEVRKSAAIALIQVGDEALFPEIVKGLRDDDAKIVIGAAVALGRIADKRVVPNLIDAFKTDNPEVGSAIAWALGQCADPAALPWLIAALEHDFAAPNVCEALGRIGDPKATSALIAALQSSNDDTRAYAARALGMLQQGNAAGGMLAARMGAMSAGQVIPALKKVIADRSKKVRLCASIALYELGDQLGGRQLVQELTS